MFVTECLLECLNVYLFTECYLHINAEKKKPEIKIDSSKSGQFCLVL